MPLPEGMTKLQDLPVGLDWQLVRAGQTPGPGQYYKDDLLASISGGKMAKGKAKTAVEWEQYRASQIPAPGQYYVDDTLGSIPGGSLAKSKAKTAVDWECYRAAQQPGPDYDLERTWAYLDGRNGRAGFTMKSRSGPAALPAPFEKFAVPGSQEIRGTPHPSHQDALTPWREADWKQRKREAAQAIHSRRARNSSLLGTQPGDEGPLKDDYASSLTPWRDQSQQKSGESSRTGEKSAASKRRHGVSSIRPESPSSARGRPRSAVGGTTQAQNSRTGHSEPALDELEQVDKTQGLDPEQKRVAAELAAMPWRDQENWAKSNAQVIRMRKEVEEKERASKTKMEQVRSPPIQTHRRRRPPACMGIQFASSCHNTARTAARTVIGACSSPWRPDLGLNACVPCNL